MKFELQLGEAYYNHGYFNVPKQFSDCIDEDKCVITIACCGMAVSGVIDRKNTKNGSPRVKGFRELKKIIQSEFNYGEFAEYEISSKNHIVMRKKQ